MIANLLDRLFKNFDKKISKKLVFLIFFTFFSNLIETTSIFLLFPYLTFLLNGALPDSIFFNFLKEYEIILANNFLLYFTFAYVLLILSSFFLRLYYLYFSNKFCFSIGTYFLDKILFNLFNIKYLDFVKLNRNQVISIFSYKIDLTIRGIIQPIINLFSTIIMIVLIVCVLLYINFTISIILFISLVLFYVLTSLLVRSIKLKNSKVIANNSDSIIKSINEIFSNNKYIFVSNLKSFYLNKISSFSNKLFLSNATNNFIGVFPKVTIESLILLSIVLFSLLAALSVDNYSKEIPYLIVLAISAQKLIPLLQQVYYSFSSLYGNYESVEELLTLLDQKKISKNIQNKQIVFNKKISFKNVYFNFKGNKNFKNLQNISFTILKGDLFGIRGPSGSGKTTLINILMGLINPTKGEIYIDDIKLSDSTIKSWQSKLSIVPQEVFLNNSSILENIALGEELNKIDVNKVKYAAKVAGINEYILTLPKKYNTDVRDGGSLLSGGQRQKIIIARSIYLNKEIFIFDEATSSLDKRSEQKIINSISSLNKTIILISHKESVLNKCHHILDIGN